MKKYAFTAMMLAAILAVSIIFTSLYVNHTEKTENSGGFTVVTSFYPIYIAALNLTDGAENVTLENLSEPQTGCLHDFQLTPEDMKLLSTADCFLINGGGIESFMTEVAEAYPDLTIVEACSRVELLQEEEDENAHAWMNVADYRIMVSTMAEALEEADPANADLYAQNAAAYDEKLAGLEEQTSELRERAGGQKVILFHEAYAYVAEELGMETAMIMDLDEERQISAGEVSQVISAVQEDGAGLILAEELYGSDMAEAVQRETDVYVCYIDPLTRGDYTPDRYLTGMQENLDLIAAYLQTQE